MLTPNEEAHIDRVCDQFESELRNSSPIRLMDFLQQVPKELQEPLLAELCGIVAEIRGNEAVEELAINFRREFPDFTDQFQSAFDKFIFATQADIPNPPRVPSSATIGDSKIIDCYRLIKQIGEGGMGTVWLAEQEQPVRRQVALKIIRGGTASSDVIARFEAERQALAMMEHPNIARILDAGTTATGNPYFVMELVSGQVLTDHCDQRGLTIEQRLDLFRQVCDGVQHAHQKGIIHRDLKPSNILVAEYDGKAVPKIIDFGLAKALDTKHLQTEHSFATVVGQVLGTFRYMSPEQANLDSLDIDTRADIFSLGIILYELLTGMTPLDADSFRGKALLHILKLIQEQESARPSMRLQSGNAESVTAAAASRCSDAKRLQQTLAGDLDWIVMKAIEKDRSDRYQTAASLADDLRRYAENEPVTARPPSFSYRSRKFVQKHRGPVAAAAALLIAIGLGLAGTIWFAVKSNQARLASDIEKQKAIDERDAGREVLAYIVSSFRSSDPWVAGIDVKVVDVLRGALQNIDTGMLKDNDRARAEFLRAIGQSLQALGDYDSSRAAYEQALVIFEAMDESNLEVIIDLQSRLAACFRNQGQFEEALRLEDKIIENSRTEYGIESVEYMNAESSKVISLRQSGDLDSALELARVNLARCREFLDQDSTATLTAMNNLAVCLIEDEALQEAEELVVELLDRRKKTLTLEHPDTIIALNLLASIRRSRGEASEAVELSTQVLEARRNLLGEDHPSTLGAMNNLALALVGLRRYEEAVPLLREAGETYARKLGNENRKTIQIVANAGAVTRMAGEPEEAARILEPVLQSAEITYGKNHPRTIDINGHYAQSLYMAGEIETGIDQYRKVLQRCRSCEPEGGQLTDLHRDRLARVLNEQGLFEEVIPLLELKAVGSVTHKNAQSKVDLANAYLRTGDFLGAEQTYGEIAAFCETSEDLEKIRFASYMYRAEALDQLGKKSEAAELAKRAREYFETIPEAQITAAFARITEARCNSGMSGEGKIKLLQLSANQLDSADNVPLELQEYYHQLIDQGIAEIQRQVEPPSAER